LAVNTTLAGLSQTPASNGPDGATDPPSSIDDAIRYALAFIAQLRDGNGFTAQLGTRNRIINGNFAINQRAVSGSVILAAGAYGHDRWKAGAAGCTYTFSTSGLDTTITISAGSLIQVIEGASIEGGTYTMSWTGTAQGKINGGAYSATGVQATGVTAGANVSVEFNVGSISKVQVECNGTASQFERRSITYEEMLCKRYFQLIYGGARFLPTAPGQATSVNVNFPVLMRATPTVATVTAGSAVNVSGLSYVASISKGFRIEMTCSVAGDSYVVDYVIGASAEL
jgi:hypothetical protein